MKTDHLNSKAMTEGQELYNKYKGKVVTANGMMGIIIGHDNVSLVMGITDIVDNDKKATGWRAKGDRFGTTFNCSIKNYPLGFWFVTELCKEQHGSNNMTQFSANMTKIM